MPYEPDVPNWAWHDYGMRVGFWRLLETLTRHKIRATAAINAHDLPRALDLFDDVGSASDTAGRSYQGRAALMAFLAETATGPMAA